MNLKSVFRNVVKFFYVKKRKGVCDMPYSIFDIAEWFLQKESMTHKKLQKMCYYAQAWAYALLDEPIICDSAFQAWVHGPVSPELYDKFKGNGWKDLYPENRNINFDNKTTELLESVYETYKDFSGNALEALTHSELPWQNARKGYETNEISNMPINPDDMKEFYLSIYSGGEE